MGVYKKFLLEYEDIGPTEPGEEEFFYTNIKKQTPNIKSETNKLSKLVNQLGDVKDGSSSLKVLQQIIRQLDVIEELCNIDKVYEKVK